MYKLYLFQDDSPLIKSFELNYDTTENILNPLSKSNMENHIET